MKPTKPLIPVVIRKKSDSAPVSTLRRVVDMSELNAKKPRDIPKSGDKHPRPYVKHGEGAPQGKKRPSSVSSPAVSRADISRDSNPRAAVQREVLPRDIVPRPPLPPAAAIAEQVAKTEVETPQAVDAVRTSSTENRKVRASRQPATRTVSGLHARVSLKKTHVASKSVDKNPAVYRETAKLRSKPQKTKVEADAPSMSEKCNQALLLQKWGARQWISSLDMFAEPYEEMFQKAVPLVQARLVNNVCVRPGSLEGLVFDQVASIAFRTFSPGQWKAVIGFLSDKAIFTTSLLNGELPEGIIDLFKQASLSLFPSKQRDFTFSCACGAEMPCEHVCAILLKFATLLEDDPTLILTLRGMTRDDLLAQCREARSGQVLDEKNKRRINYEVPAQNINFNEFFTAKGDFGDLKFHIAYSRNPLMKRLGNPSSWDLDVSMDTVFAPLVEITAHAAENLGLAEVAPFDPDDDSMPAPEDPANAPINRSPRASARTPRIYLPDLSFVRHELDREILDALPEDPVTTAEAILTWLKTKGASDIRTLARRTRLHKPMIEGFLKAFCDAGICTSEGENEKMRFMVTF